jgi:hypothetical protein
MEVDSAVDQASSSSAMEVEDDTSAGKVPSVDPVSALMTHPQQQVIPVAPLAHRLFRTLSLRISLRIAALYTPELRHASMYLGSYVL